MPFDLIKKGLTSKQIDPVCPVQMTRDVLSVRKGDFIPFFSAFNYKLIISMFGLELFLRRIGDFYTQVGQAATNDLNVTSLKKVQREECLMDHNTYLYFDPEKSLKILDFWYTQFYQNDN